MNPAHILVVDDEPDIRSSVQDILEDEGYDVSTASDARSAREARKARKPDLVLMDIWMPDTDGISLLKEWAEEDTDYLVPVIMISGHGTIETAVEATRLGAYDYLEKPLSLSKLLITVEHALEADKLKRENIAWQRRIQPLQEPIGRSNIMQSLREQIQKIAQHDTCVLITGEAGSGKRIAARYLHNNSARKDGPFIEISVATIARENSAMELFGHEKEGRVHFGRLEQANGGTLFLDEINDMDIDTQAKLLGALENRSFMRIGGSTSVKLDVRIIAATHKNLEKEVHDGNFRDDLYYKLNVVPVFIPPLREHVQDIPELINHYVTLYVERDNLPYRSFSVAAQNKLRNYPWPGNVRELENLVQRLLILGTEDEISPEEIESALVNAYTLSEHFISRDIYELPLKQARELFERNYLKYRLQECNNNVTQLASITGMERTNLYRKLRALGIDIKNTQE